MTLNIVSAFSRPRASVRQREQKSVDISWRLAQKNGFFHHCLKMISLVDARWKLQQGDLSKKNLFLIVVNLIFCSWSI